MKFLLTFLLLIQITFGQKVYRLTTVENGVSTFIPLTSVSSTLFAVDASGELVLKPFSDFTLPSSIYINTITPWDNGANFEVNGRSLFVGQTQFGTTGSLGQSTIANAIINSDGSIAFDDGAITSDGNGNITSANLSNNNTGDDAANTNYENDYRAANFIAGTDYLAPNGSAANLTGFPTFNQNTTGNATSATSATTLTRIQTAYRTADFNRNLTAVLANDSIMVLSLDANSVYEISAWIELSCPATVGYQFRVLFSSALDGTNGNSNLEYGLNGGALSAYTITSSTGIGSTITRTTLSDRYVTKFTGTIRTLSACSVSIQWAQNSSDAQNTTLKLGSYLRTFKVYP